MRDNILLSYVAIDALFVMTGGLLIIFALTTKAEIEEQPTLESVARILILGICPLNAAIANAIMIFFTFLMSIPGIIMPLSRGWLKFSGYMTVISAVFTLIIGLSIWFETLKTRRNLSEIWNVQPASTQSLLQTKFDCCGYANSTSPPFVPNDVCTSPIIAAAKLGCVSRFSSFANSFLDLIFTGAFGIVGVDVLLVFATAVLLKDRKEKERYRHIDEKNGEGAF